MKGWPHSINSRENSKSFKKLFSSSNKKNIISQVKEEANLNTLKPSKL